MIERGNIIQIFIINLNEESTKWRRIITHEREEQGENDP
jgi:hypothetical protein